MFWSKTFKRYVDDIVEPYARCKRVLVTLDADKSGKREVVDFPVYLIEHYDDVSSPSHTNSSVNKHK